MKLQNKLGLAIVSLLAASGCARSARVASVHVEEPGTHIVTGQGAISIAKNTSTGSRVCTRVLPAPTKAKGKHEKGRAPTRDPGARLDILLFRLCEARSNGDISAEQYASSVQSIVKAMEQMANRPQVSMVAPPRGVGPRFRGPRGRRFQPGWGRPDRDDDDQPARPEPKRETPK
jgi:hypothetical protein